MTRHTLVGELPRHHYIWIDTRYTHQTPHGFVPAVWFGLVSYPGRTWGCTVLLESGAIYRNLPPHALAFSAMPEFLVWTPQDAQAWDCYGTDFTTLEYAYLQGLDCRVRANGQEYAGQYLFTVAPVGDGFSAYPEQAKEFVFVRLDNGRLTIQPTNHLIFQERSFTGEQMNFPTGLKRQTEIWCAE